MLVQECEISKFSHEPRPDFSFFLLYLHTLLRAFLACPTLGSSRILERLCHFLLSPWSPEELSQRCCNPLGQLLPECWCYSALVSLGKGDLPEAIAFCIPAKQHVTSDRTQGELRAQCAFPKGMEEHEMLPEHPMSWAPAACVSRRKGDKRHA